METNADRSGASDAAAFEKTLSSLSAKIARTSASNDALRRRSRRLRVLWTLYATFGYIFASLILVLVVGWKKWKPIEWAAVTGGPFVIYAVRTALASYYTWRINKTQSHLDSLYTQRDATIAQLKQATKYDSTQQLLEKYAQPRQHSDSASPAGGADASKHGIRGRQSLQSGGAGDGRQSLGGPQQQPQLPFQPPPTANIQRPSTAPGPASPHAPPSSPPFSSPHGLPRPPSALSPDAAALGPTAEFAPNAFDEFDPPPPPPPVLQAYAGAPPPPAPGSAPAKQGVLDRLLDALLGDDETAPRNRVALICERCRLVNGTAPPGVTVLEEVGRWRCAGCGAWNGVERERERGSGAGVAGVGAGEVRGVERPRWSVKVEDVDAEKDGDSEGERSVNVGGDGGDYDEAGAEGQTEGVAKAEEDGGEEAGTARDRPDQKGIRRRGKGKEA
ncbi:hypothetical protein BDY21DRAFT_382261 [Lineolata rhizophorae]|uniref:Endoplasmic reticulum junction formation protein lunapark n=1 Tax=Lineolata rhizophorae TaxID=578093 RepID=A0A6A6NNY6_9PEZI|nr:hypothetical protein BDY21DRAFT_382261 [Lineolata rhizophorae]